VIGDYSQILSICQKGDVDRIIVALDERRGKFPLEQLLFCRLKGIRIDDGVVSLFFQMDLKDQPFLKP
jgi:hypothetical protein